MLKYIKQFANHTAYQSAESNLDKPNVSLCVQEDEVHYNPYVDLIYIHYHNYQVPALRGMTWEEYISSEYNTGQYTNIILSIDSGNVVRWDQGIAWYLVDDNKVFQHSTDIIDETKVYSFPAD